MNIFYCPAAVLNEHCELDEQESHHLIKVLRKQIGAELYVFDGKGHLFDARLESAGKKTAVIHIVKLIEQANNDGPKLHLAVAPPKNMDRMEWLAEKITEIGVHEITPIICQHSERKDLRNDRLGKVLVSACKQSKHLTVPKLNHALPFDKFIASVNSSYRKYIAYCDDKAIHLQQAYHGGFDAVVMIGPEGDFAKEEVLAAGVKEFETVSLGKSRLRLETAAIYATTVFNLANES